MDHSQEEVLNFWFSEIDSKLWFNSTAELDEQIKQRFESVYQAALSDKLDDWQKSPEGSLALVIVLDQFPLNMYRDKHQSFAGEVKARQVTKQAIDKRFDQSLSDKEKAFLYLPLMHSEDLADQDLSVELFEKAGLEHNLRYAKHHREIVRKYGRFPHRNRILGRESTAEEIEYLNSDEAFLG